MCEDIHIREQWQLLQNLRSTVEGLLIDGIANVWNVYGGLNRLHNAMKQIFKHGCIFHSNGEPDCWIFIQGLNWLQPSLAESPIISENEDYLCNLPTKIVSRKDMLWLYKSLESHSLSHKLSWLLSDKEHLLSCMEPWAFLCQENLAEATLICLRAVERNQPVLLAEIDPCLFQPNWISSNLSPKTHRRSSSYPVNFSSTTSGIPRERKVHIQAINQLEPLTMTYVNKSIPNTVSQDDKSSTNENIVNKVDKKSDISLKAWSSLPALDKSHKSLLEDSMTVSSSTKEPCVHKTVNIDKPPVELSVIIHVNYPDLKQSRNSTADNITTKPKTPIRKIRNKTKLVQEKLTINRSSGSSDTLNYEDSVRGIVEECFISSEDTDGTHLTKYAANSNAIKIDPKLKKKAAFLPASAPEFSSSWTLEIEGQKYIRTPKKSFMEDGGSSVQPMATGYFPRPVEGQSLTSFLSSAQFSKANAELDRENAHFNISEAMIAAIEQIKCNRQWCLVDETVEDSDEEINNLKQRIRIRRRQRQQERYRGKTWNRELLSDGKTDTTTTDQSVSPLSTSSDTPSDSISTDDVEDIEVDKADMIKLKNSGVSASMASLYSGEDLHQFKQGLESSQIEGIVSAEGVALSLISRFSEKQLPRASELQWLVSEKDAPQRLLPLPKSWPVSPDEVEIEESAPIRGTMDWAPPRPQIIFTPHPPPVRRTLIAKQNYRCAGCGMKVAVKYANRFRYCEYLGRYFCTGCHTNQVALIPGKILSKWDFNRYPVSNFSYRLLDQMTLDPLFQIQDLNSSLYRRIKQLERTRIIRTKLFYLKDFLYTCRFAENIQDVLKKEPNYILNDPHVYSIQDLMYVKLGILPMKLQEIIEVCDAHVTTCELCQARGFVCEICYSEEVIYPWELSKITRCEICGACYHNECKQPANKLECRRCDRLQARRVSRQEAL